METFLLLSKLCKLSQFSVSDEVVTNEGLPFYDACTLTYRTQQRAIVVRCGHAVIVCLCNDVSCSEEMKSCKEVVDVTTSDMHFGRCNRVAHNYAMGIWDQLVTVIDGFLDRRSPNLFSTYSLDTLDTSGTLVSKIKANLPPAAAYQNQSVISVLRVNIESGKLLRLHKFAQSFFETSDGKPCIVFTGFGLGAACCILAAKIAHMYQNEVGVRCVTFGSPALCDKVLYGKFNSLMRNYNVVLKEDAHCEIFKGKPYTRPPNQVLLRNDGNYNLKELMCCQLPYTCIWYTIEDYTNALAAAARVNFNSQMIGCVNTPTSSLPTSIISSRLDDANKSQTPI